MSEQDIKEIKELLITLDKKIEIGLTEVRGDVKRLDEKIEFFRT